jgi:hypothetical protein
MQALIREKLADCLSKLGAVTQIYQQDPTRFAQEYLRWLQTSEESLSPLRLPLVATLQSQKTQLLAIEDGLLPAHLSQTASPRKRQRAAAAALMEHAVAVLQHKLEQIDKQLAEPREKLSQGLALLLSQQPSALSRTKPTLSGARNVWNKLQALPELNHLCSYLCTQLTSSDRDYLLMSLISNVRGDR